MSLISFPVKFNNEAICDPESWSESSEVVENVNATEAGTDQVSVTRYDKLSISASFQCSSTWAKKLKEYSMMDSINVSLYDFLEQGYKTRVMRIREFKADLVENSRRTPNTAGLWNVSFSLKEF